jgi:hypothetical protein
MSKVQSEPNYLEKLGLDAEFLLPPALTGLLKFFLCGTEHFVVVWLRFGCKQRWHYLCWRPDQIPKRYCHPGLGVCDIVPAWGQEIVFDFVGYYTWEVLEEITD